MKTITIVVIFFLLVFWPVSLILHNLNQPLEVITYIVPAILLALTFKYYKDDCWYYIFPLILIPLIAPKLILFPLLFGLIELIVKKQKKVPAILFISSIILLGIQWSNFYGQTIFKTDYEAGQAVIRKQLLYPTPFTARLFANKARIVIDKFNDNFFALLDPNNYFFGFAPRQIVGNQNLQKFPFISLTFLLFGVYYLNKSKYDIFIIVASIASVLSLSVLSIFDRNDFILFIPLLLVLFHGMSSLEKKYSSQVKYLYAFFVAFSLVEFIRILI